MSKDFFLAIKPKPSKTLISTLRDEDGNVLSRKEDLKIICRNFYKLYQAKENTLEQIGISVRWGFGIITQLFF
jgi:hypothetical protein